MSHIRKLDASMQILDSYVTEYNQTLVVKFYSKPMGEVSYPNYEYHYWFVAKICFTIWLIKCIFGIAEVCRVCYAVAIHFRCHFN